MTCYVETRTLYPPCSHCCRPWVYFSCRCLSMWMLLVLLAPVVLLQCHSCHGFIVSSPNAFSSILVSNDKYVFQQQQQHQKQKHWTLQTPPPTSSKSTSPTTSLTMSSTITSTIISNASTNMYRLGATIGMTGLLCQCVLTKIFQRYALTKENAGYTAHTVVAFVFMTYLSIVGSIGWFCGGTGSSASFVSSSLFASLSPFDRLLLPNVHCQHMATVVTGLLLLWDLPTSLVVRPLRKIDVLVHHAIMTITSYFAATIIPMHYVYFYFGVSEISSIPLLLYDQLCVWTNPNVTPPRSDGIDDSDVPSASTAVGTITPNGDKNISDALIPWRDRIQIIAAISFTTIRAILFTYVTICHFIPDTLSVLSRSSASLSRMIQPMQLQALRFALYASIGFTALQLFWFSQMLHTIYRQLMVPSKS